jgi:hypothetical protein
MPFIGIIYIYGIFSAISSFILGLKYFLRLIIILQIDYRLYNIIFKFITIIRYESFYRKKIRSDSTDINDIDNILNVIFEKREYSFLRIFYFFKNFSHRVNISAQYFSYSSSKSLL